VTKRRFKNNRVFDFVVSTYILSKAVDPISIDKLLSEIRDVVKKDEIERLFRKEVEMLIHRGFIRVFDYKGKEFIYTTGKGLLALEGRRHVLAYFIRLIG